MFFFDWSSLFLFSSIVNSLLGILFVYSTGKVVADKKSTFWLILIIIGTGIVSLEYIIRNSGIVIQYPHFLFIASPVYFFLLPAILIFLRTLAQQPVKPLVHMVVPFAFMVLMIPTYSMSAHNKINMFTTPNIREPWFIILVYLIFFLFYIYKIYQQIKLYQQELYDQFSSNHVEWEIFSMKFIKGLSLLILFIPLLICIQYFPFTNETKIILKKFCVVGFSLSGHLILLFLFRRTPIKFKASKPIQPSVDSFPDQKAALDLFIQSEKCYLNKILTLDELADQIGWGRTLLSQVINSGQGENFYDYINGYRLRLFEARMQNGDYKEYSLDHIVSECGFANYVTFYRFFKRKKGMTPSLFIKHLSEG